MEAELIAPCGINCNICSSHLRKKNPCPGCPERASAFKGKCVVINCEERKASVSGFCYECRKYPCRRIRRIDERYRKIGISNIENLGIVKEKGVAYLLEKEQGKWKCPECGAVMANNGVCFSCGIEKLRSVKKL